MAELIGENANTPIANGGALKGQLSPEQQTLELTLLKVRSWTNWDGQLR